MQRSRRIPLPKDIVILDGHPDPDPGRFCHTIARTYAEAASQAGHRVQSFKIAQLDFPILRSRDEWEAAEPSTIIQECQTAISVAHHVVLIYPLWLGDVPALLKAFLEQVFRPGFAIQRDARALSPGLLRGKSARVIVTMGMPALIYRAFFFAHSVRSLRRNILRFVGLGPVRESIIGSVESSANARVKWLERIRLYARTGE
jgi:putative NADPH-quinone reductase